MPDHSIFPDWANDLERVIEFPSMDSGDVRVTNDGDITWRRPDTARWEPVNVAKQLGKAIFESVAVELDLSHWRRDRIQELLQGAANMTPPQPAQRVSGAQPVRTYDLGEKPNEVIKQGIAFTGGPIEVRLGDDGTNSKRYNGDSIWDPASIPSEVAQTLRHSCTNLLKRSADERRDLEELQGGATNKTP